MRKYIIITALAVCSLCLQAQERYSLTFGEYMKRVYAGNLAYAAERLNVGAAKADAVAARVFSDPELSAGYFNNQDGKLQMGQGFEIGITQTFSMGKRVAGMRLAQSESELVEALLEDYLRNLRADAAIAYMDVLRQKQLCEVRKSSCMSLKKMSEADSIRFSKGKITAVESVQSSLEHGMTHNELMQAEAELQTTAMVLSVMMGTAQADTVYMPREQLVPYERDFTLTDLIATAQANRADIVAALKNTEVAARRLTVARRDRRPDIDLTLSMNRNSRVRNEEAPAPPFTGISVGVAIPLRFSAVNKGAVNAARLRMEQARVQYRQATMQVQTEVAQAYSRYRSLREQLRRYDDGLLKQAKEVLDGKIYSYRRGEAPLLEYLDAQRTYDDVRAQYIETLYSCNVALVELERCVGIWDIK